MEDLPGKSRSKRAITSVREPIGRRSGSKPTDEKAIADAKRAKKIETGEARPTSLPDFVKGASPAERKAAMEAIAASDPILASAPWKRKREVPSLTNDQAPRPRELVKPMEKAADRPVAAPATGKRVVLLDTNALMMQFQFHVDIERELRRILDFAYEIAVPSTVVNELESIAKEGVGKDSHEARMALELAKTFKVLTTPGEGDTGILRLAVNINAIVVSNDKILRARLRAKDVPAVYMRSKAFLTVEGHVPGM